MSGGRRGRGGSRDNRMRENLPVSPYERADEVIFEPLGFDDPAFAPANPAAPEARPMPAAQTYTNDPQMADTLQNEPLIDLTGRSTISHGSDQPADHAPLDFGAFRTPEMIGAASGTAGDVDFSDLGFAPAAPSPYAPVLAPWGEADDPRPFGEADDTSIHSMAPADGPLGDNFFEYPVPPPLPAARPPAVQARKARRMPLGLRLALPILAVTVGSVALMLMQRNNHERVGARTEKIASLRTLELDNSQAEGTLLRTRRAIERTVVAGVTLSDSAVRDTVPYLEQRQLELDTFEDNLKNADAPAALKTGLTSAYAEDHAFVDDSIAILRLAASDANAAADRLKANIEVFYDRVEDHRNLATNIDKQADAQSTGLSDDLAKGSWPLLLGAAGLLLLGLLGAISAARAVRNPLRSITRTVNSVADGDLAVRTGIAGSDQIGRLGFAVDSMTESLTEAVGQLEDDARRGSQNRIVFEALDIADSESEVHRVAEQAMGLFAPQVPGELLLSEQNGGRLWRVASSPTAGAPGCTIESPAGCFALRRGQTVIFESADSINSCPKLRNRPGGSCSAVCIPVSFSGQALGVLHTTGADHEPPEQGTVDQLVDLASQLGARIGTLRTLESTRLQAATDGLTGLPNRRMIEARVAELIADRVSFVMILADLDRFKSINDRFGHEVGDRSLQLFARTLQDNVRDADLVARYGGEEFVIVYPEMTVGGSMEAIERLRLALITAQANSAVPGFTCSFGVTHSSVGTSFDEIFRVADAGLMVAKEMGRNRSIYADRELADRVFGQGIGRDSALNAQERLRARAAEGDDIEGADWSTEFLADDAGLLDAERDDTGEQPVTRLRRRDLGQPTDS